MKRKLPLVLLIIYIILFIVLSINPFSRDVWLAENLPIILIVLALALTYKKFQFSNYSYVLMSVLIYLHTIGGHFTFERVPFDFITNLFSFERNHFDRIAHFSVGFYAYPLAELLLKTKATTKKWVLALFPICFIIAVAGAYEVIEWWYAVSSNPDAGIAFLGSQGDVWDAQKDILADTLGSFLAMILFWIKEKKTIKKLN